jgi:putative membrane protein (TIGR04086 family)
MRHKSIFEPLIKSIKALIIAALIFLIIITGFGLMVRFTPLPERFAMYYAMAAMCIACLFLGIYAGGLLKRRGLLYGMLYSAVFLAILLLVIVSRAGVNEGFVFLQPKYLACLLFGGLGGIAGVNMRS